MRKTVLLVILSCLAYSGNSQKLDLGFQFSPLGSWMSAGGPIKSDGVGVAYSFGLMLDFAFAENYLISSGIYITQNVGKIEYIENSPFISGELLLTNQDSIQKDTKAKYIARYIEIPLTLRLRTNEIGYFRYWGLFGLTPGINIKKRAEFEIPGTSTSSPTVIFEQMSAFNLSLTLGGGIEYSLGGNTRLITGLIFNNGFIDLTVDEQKVIMNYLQLRLGIMF